MPECETGIKIGAKTAPKVLQLNALCECLKMQSGEPQKPNAIEPRLAGTAPKAAQIQYHWKSAARPCGAIASNTLSAHAPERQWRARSAQRSSFQSRAKSAAGKRKLTMTITPNPSPCAGFARRITLRLT